MNVKHSSIVLAFKFDRATKVSCIWSPVHVEPVVYIDCAAQSCLICKRNENKDPTTHLASFFIDQRKDGFWRAEKHDKPMKPDELEHWEYIRLHSIDSERVRIFLDQFVGSKFNKEYWHNFIPPWSWWSENGAKHSDDFSLRKRWFCSELVAALLIELDYAHELTKDLEPYKTSPTKLYELVTSIEGVVHLDNMLPTV
jgi:hypothetical protein